MKWIIIAMLAFLTVPMTALALDGFPSFPMAFWGAVTIDGVSAPADTVVRAYYEDQLAGQIVVQEDGVYGYTEPTKQKLLVSEGEGEITFKFQTTSLNDDDDETEGITSVTHPSFISGGTENKDLTFVFTETVDSPSPVGGGGGGGGSSGGGGGGGGGGGIVTTQIYTKGDTNSDNKIDIFDFNTLMINWGSTDSENRADIDGNNLVDIFDFNLLMINWTG